MANPVARPTPIQLKTHWATDELPQQVVGEALLAYVGDLVYITLGQTQIPVPKADGKAPDAAEIRAVARLVLSPAAFHKIRKMMNSVAEQIPGGDE